MIDLMTVRSSSLPLVFRCAGAARSAELLVSETGEAATNGTAAHEALRSLAETGSLDWDAIPGIAEQHGADVEEVRALCAMASKLWPQVAESFPSALTEVELSADVAGVRLTGHLDLLSVTDRVARAGDWKTGRKDSDYGQQMRGYAALVLLDDPALTEVTVTVIWVREAEIENYTMRRADLAPWLRQFTATVVEWDGVFRPGTHCVYCPRSHECQAANAMARRDVSALADRALVARAESELAAMTPEEIIELCAKASMVEGFAKRVREAIKKHVLANGDVVANDGRRLTIVTEERRELDPIKAWPVLEDAGFEGKDFAACMDLRISRVEKLVAQRQPRGKGAAAVRALGAVLDAAGAVGVNEVKKLTERRS